MYRTRKIDDRAFCKAIAFMYAGCINEKLRRRAEPYNGENAIAWSKRKQAVNAVFALPVVYFFLLPVAQDKMRAGAGD